MLGGCAHPATAASRPSGCSRPDAAGPSSSAGPTTIGQQTSHIKNKQVRSAKYGKLKHEAKKAKKKARKAREAEATRAAELGLEPPPKPVPKVCGCIVVAVAWRAAGRGGLRRRRSGRSCTQLA